MVNLSTIRRLMNNVKTFIQAPPDSLTIMAVAMTAKGEKKIHFCSGIQADDGSASASPTQANFAFAERGIPRIHMPSFRLLKRTEIGEHLHTPQKKGRSKRPLA